MDATKWLYLNYLMSHLSGWAAEVPEVVQARNKCYRSWVVYWRSHDDEPLEVVVAN